MSEITQEARELLLPLLNELAAGYLPHVPPTIQHRSDLKAWYSDLWQHCPAGHPCLESEWDRLAERWRFYGAERARAVG